MESPASCCSAWVTAWVALQHLCLQFVEPALPIGDCTKRLSCRLLRGGHSSLVCLNFHVGRAGLVLRFKCCCLWLGWRGLSFQLLRNARLERSRRRSQACQSTKLNLGPWWIYSGGPGYPCPARKANSSRRTLRRGNAWLPDFVAGVSVLSHQPGSGNRPGRGPAGPPGRADETLGRGESQSPAAPGAQEMAVAAANGADVAGMPGHLLGRLRRTVRAGTTTKARGSPATIDVMLRQVRRLGLTSRASAEPLVG